MDLCEARRLNKPAYSVKDPLFLLERGVLEEISTYNALILQVRRVGHRRRTIHGCISSCSWTFFHKFRIASGCIVDASCTLASMSSLDPLLILGCHVVHPP